MLRIPENFNAKNLLRATYLRVMFSLCRFLNFCRKFLSKVASSCFLFISVTILSYVYMDGRKDGYMDRRWAMDKKQKEKGMEKEIREGKYERGKEKI